MIGYDHLHRRLVEHGRPLDLVLAMMLNVVAVQHAVLHLEPPPYPSAKPPLSPTKPLMLRVHHHHSLSRKTYLIISGPSFGLTSLTKRQEACLHVQRSVCLVSLPPNHHSSPSSRLTSLTKRKSASLHVDCTKYTPQGRYMTFRCRGGIYIQGTHASSSPTRTPKKKAVNYVT